MDVMTSALKPCLQRTEDHIWSHNISVAWCDFPWVSLYVVIVVGRNNCCGLEYGDNHTMSLCWLCIWHVTLTSVSPHNLDDMHTHCDTHTVIYEYSMNDNIYVPLKCSRHVWFTTFNKYKSSSSITSYCYFYSQANSPTQVHTHTPHTLTQTYMCTHSQSPWVQYLALHRDTHIYGIYTHMYIFSPCT